MEKKHACATRLSAIATLIERMTPWSASRPPAMFPTIIPRPRMASRTGTIALWIRVTSVGVGAMHTPTL